jgi:PmbA protein
LLEQAGNGVYINALGGLHAGANVISGDFSLQSAGFLIENGKKTKAVKSFTVAGNFFDLLRQITALSDTVKLPMATGSTNYGSPSVLVEGLSIAGK